MDPQTRNIEKVAQRVREQDEKLAFDLDVLQNIAKGVKELFLNSNLLVVKEKGPSFYTWYLIVTYRHLMFFPDEEILQKFKEAGLGTYELKRFVPHQDLTGHLEALSKDESFILLKHQAFLHIKEYLETKIAYDLLQWAGLSTHYNGRYAMPKSTIFLRNFFRKRAYRGAGPREVKNELEQDYHDMIEKINELTGDENITRSTLLKISNGRTEKIYLKGVTEDCYPKLRSDKFYRKFFPLFKLLVTDRNFPTEDDIYRRQRYYGRTFESVQSQFIRKLIN